MPERPPGVGVEVREPVVGTVWYGEPWAGAEDPDSEFSF